MLGRIIANYGQLVAVRTQSHDVIQCKTLRRTGLLVSGDYVEYQQQDDQSFIVEKINERRSCLARPDRKGQLKPLAANIDQLLIVIAAKPIPDWNMVSAYLVYAKHHQLQATIVLNKSDLLDDEKDIKNWAHILSCLDYGVIKTCCKTGDGLNALLKSLTQHTSVLVGQSGVGKSSIVKSLLPDQQIQINAISAATGLGSHTTTTTTLYQLLVDGDLIDSPGVRQFSVEQLDPESIREGFVEFEPYAGQCQFTDCTHLHEPNCAILSAVEKGKIFKQRWQQYKELLQRLT